MRIHRTALIAALTLSPGSFIMGAQAAARLHSPAYVTGSCTVKATEFAADDGFFQTASTKFNGLVGYEFYQSQAGCVAGSFFGNAGNASAGDHVLLEVLLDGSPCHPLGPTYYFANSGDDFSSHATGYFCGTNIAVGTHWIEVQIASAFGGYAQMYQWTLEIRHN